MIKDYILVIVPSGDWSDKNLINFDYWVKLLKLIYKEKIVFIDTWLKLPINLEKDYIYIDIRDWNFEMTKTLDLIEIY